MLARLRHAAHRSGRTLEYGLLVAAIVAVLVLVAFALDSYVHHGAEGSCPAGVLASAGDATPGSCSQDLSP